MKQELVKKALRVTETIDEAVAAVTEYQTMDIIKCVAFVYGPTYYVLALGAVRECSDEFKKQLKPMLVEGDVNSF